MASPRCSVTRNCNTDNNACSPIIQTDHEMETCQESLSRAKDRAQLTATGAMSIVNVALLKQIYDQGPEENPYYTMSLSLIYISLSLQVLAGLLAIIMTSVTGYYTKHQDDICEDLCENIFGYRCSCCPPRTSRHPGNNMLSRQPFEGNAAVPEVIELSDLRPNGGPIPETGFCNAEEARTAQNIGCCPCVCTSKTLEDFEYDILDCYDDWQVREVSLNLKAAESKIMLQHLVANISELKSQIQEIGSGCSPDNGRRESLEQQLEETKGKVRLKHEEITRSKISRAQGQYLRDRATAIRKNKILKRATFGQHVINFLFFIVFILNAFITGFGIVGNDDKKSLAEDPTMTTGAG